MPDAIREVFDGILDEVKEMPLGEQGGRLIVRGNDIKVLKTV